MASREVHYTLPGRDYRSDEVFAAEQARIFHADWFYVGREEQVEAPGSCLVVDVAGESILLVRSRDDGKLRAFYNVCRHRGAQLCDPEDRQLKGAVKCPYHAWAYAHDGTLIGSPNVRPDEVDRSALSLWPAAVDAWEGFVFVNLADEPVPLLDRLTADGDDGPLPLERFGLGPLRIGHRTVQEVDTNWKILIENYNECLHCPTVHPELVALIPIYRTGSVVDDTRADGGVGLADGADSFTVSGRSRVAGLPGLTEEEASSYFGCVVFPNMFIDITGTSAIATTLLPRSPSHTTIISEYLFTPEALAAPDFDPSEIVDFSELVAKQDYVVCERVQRGISSKAFTRGVYAEKDDMLHEFNQRYLASRGPVD